MPQIDLSRLQELAEYGNAETKLALGLKIPFSRAGVYELELIPGISDRLAFEMVSKRQVIISLARKFPPAQKYRALTVVPGIGVKTAGKIGEFLDLTS